MTSGASRKRVFNFGAGPSTLPLPVLEKVQEELINYDGSGMSVMELSHRSASYEKVHNDCQKHLRQLLSIPESEYEILLMQGGASHQFACVPYNLLESLSPSDVDEKAAYVVSGVWSEKAYKEAVAILGSKDKVVLLQDTSKEKHTGNINKDVSKWNWPAKAPKYVYYCDNETVHGVEFPSNPFSVRSGSQASEYFTGELPEYFKDPSKRPLIVCDMSSNFASRRFNVSDYDVIIAGAQKNVGPSGVTFVIIRKSLLKEELIKKRKHHVPLMLDYKLQSDNNSLYNTPPTFTIYVCDLVLKYLLETYVSLEALEKANSLKAEKLYEYFEKHSDFYFLPVRREFRSRMNIPVRLLGKDGKPSEEFEKTFVKSADKAGMVQLAGHRSVGGIRVSLYNAMTIDGVLSLLAFLEDFRLTHSKSE